MEIEKYDYSTLRQWLASQMGFERTRPPRGQGPVALEQGLVPDEIQSVTRGSSEVANFASLSTEPRGCTLPGSRFPFLIALESFREFSKSHPTLYTSVHTYWLGRP